MAGFNKMFVMVPVMLAARKLDGEDPTVIYWLRVAYFSVQALVIILVAYTYIQATKIAAKQGNDRIVYIPPAPSVCLFCVSLLKQVCVFFFYSMTHSLFPNTAVCRSQRQEKVYRNCLQQTHFINGQESLGIHTLWHCTHHWSSLLQGHDYWFGHSEYHGTL